MKAIRPVCHLLLLALCSAAAAPASGPSASDAVESAAREAITILQDKALAPAEQSQQIRQLAIKNLDFDTLSRLTLGHYWTDLPDAKRVEFRDELRQHILNVFSRLIDRYSGQDLAIISERAERDGDWTIRASIYKPLPNGGRDEKAKVDFRVRPRAEGGWKLIDLSTNGVSMLGIFRAQFQSIITNGGGIDALIKTLRDKNAAAAAGTSVPSTAPSAPGK